MPNTRTRRRNRKHVGGADPITIGVSAAPVIFGIFHSKQDGATKIWENLQKIPLRKCIVCSNQLPTTMVYNSRSLAGRLGTQTIGSQKTDQHTAIMRSYPLSTGNRIWTLPGFPNVQPTIFYFHCPHCAYLYQFKGAIAVRHKSRKGRSESRKRAHSDPLHVRHKSRKSRKSSTSVHPENAK